MSLQQLAINLKRLIYFISTSVYQYHRICIISKTWLLIILLHAECYRGNCSQKNCNYDKYHFETRVLRRSQFSILFYSSFFILRLNTIFRFVYPPVDIPFSSIRVLYKMPGQHLEQNRSVKSLRVMKTTKLSASMVCQWLFKNCISFILS